MRFQSRELVATDEPAIITKPVLDAVVMKNGESDGCFPDPSCANEGYGFEVFGETNKLFNELVKQVLQWGWGR